MKNQPEPTNDLGEKERALLWGALFRWRELLRKRYGTYSDKTWEQHHIAVWH